MDPREFLATHRPGLIATLEAYCGGQLSHEGAAAAAWAIIDAFATVRIPSQSLAPGEEIFWSAVWALQHLADESHWVEGNPPADLCISLAALVSNKMPEGWAARRPTA